MEASRRDVFKIGTFGILASLIGASTENVAAQTELTEKDVEGACVYKGPLENGSPAKSADDGCTYCYIEYTDSGGPGALWITTQDDSTWELLHSTTDELRLEDVDNASRDEVGIVNIDGKLYKRTYA